MTRSPQILTVLTAVPAILRRVILTGLGCLLAATGIARDSAHEIRLLTTMIFPDDEAEGAYRNALGSSLVEIFDPDSQTSGEKFGILIEHSGRVSFSTLKSDSNGVGYAMPLERQESAKISIIRAVEGESRVIATIPAKASGSYEMKFAVVGASRADALRTAWSTLPAPNLSGAILNHFIKVESKRDGERHIRSRVTNSSPWAFELETLRVEITSVYGSLAPDKNEMRFSVENVVIKSGETRELREEVWDPSRDSYRLRAVHEPLEIAGRFQTRFEFAGSEASSLANFSDSLAQASVSQTEKELQSGGIRPNDLKEPIMQTLDAILRQLEKGETGLAVELIQKQLGSEDGDMEEIWRFLIRFAVFVSERNFDGALQAAEQGNGAVQSLRNSGRGEVAARILGSRLEKVVSDHQNAQYPGAILRSRAWTTSEGKALYAALGHMDDVNVVLVARDGQTRAFPRLSFSESDQLLFALLAKLRGEAVVSADRDEATEANESLWTPGESEVFRQFLEDRAARKEAEAISAVERLVAMCVSNHGPYSLQTARSLHEAGAHYRQAGRLDEAGTRLDRAWKIRTVVLGAIHVETQASLEELALLAVDQGTPVRTQNAANLMVAAKRVLIAKALPGMEERKRLDYLRELRPYDLAASLDSGSAVAEAVLMAKGIVLESLLEERRDSTASWKAGFDDLVEKTRLLKDQLLADPAAPGTIKRETQKLDLKRMESELARRRDSANGTLHSLAITAAAVSGVLPEDMALIEYLKYDRYQGQGRQEPHYGAVILRPGRRPVFVNNGPARQIDDAIFSWRSAIAGVAAGNVDNKAVEEGGRALHRCLIEGLAPHLEGVRRFVISPDAALNFVPFGALPDDHGQLMVEHGTIYYVASGRDLVAKESLGAWVKSPALILGDPGFEAVPGGDRAAAIRDSTASVVGSIDRAALSTLEFAPLSGTRTEALIVGEVLQGRESERGPAVTKLGEEATEKLVRDLRSPDILHLATHGFFLEEVSTRAGEPGGGESNPMLRTGVALSGAQTTVDRWRRGETPDPEDDGILLATEVGDLDLRGTELVTLSACQTAMGEAVPGEGVMGMRRAFAMAGARNVMMTLWDIADEPTAAFMSDFYRRYGEIGSAPQALSDVQREWLVRLRAEKGLAVAAFLAGPFVMSAQAPRQPVNSLGMKFAEVPGTDILMSIWETRARDFWIFAAENPGLESAWMWEDELEASDNPMHSDIPMKTVTWRHAKAFCDWLSKREGIPYRLPTDHEWSMAVGIGHLEDPNFFPESKHLKIVGIYPWGSEWPPPKGAGNFGNWTNNDPARPDLEDDHPVGPAPVGSYKPNSLGIFDLAGNVHEWCEDTINPLVDYPVYRGSDSSDDAPEELMSSVRYHNNRGNGVAGFRCVIDRKLLK